MVFVTQHDEKESKPIRFYLICGVVHFGIIDEGFRENPEQQ